MFKESMVRRKFQISVLSGVKPFQILPSVDLLIIRNARLLLENKLLHASNLSFIARLRSFQIGTVSLYRSKDYKNMVGQTLRMIQPSRNSALGV